MPLEHSKSKKAFEHNVKAEIGAGKKPSQAVAIAYSEKRKVQDKEEISKIREKPGMSGAHKYEGTKAGRTYAGPDKTFPIGDLKHAKNALARAHFAKNPSTIEENVYKKYPALKERHKEREGVEKKKYDAYRSR